MKPRYAIVLPARRMTRQAQGFDYLIPPSLRSALRVGDIVDIPFRARELSGVVVELRAKTTQPTERLKNVVRIRKDLPRFPEPYLRWLQWFSKEYGVSPAHGIHRAFADVPKRASQASQNRVRRPHVPIRLTKLHAQEILQATKKIRGAKPHLLQWWNAIERDAFYYFLCRSAAQQSKQILLIFPTQEAAERLYARLPSTLQQKTELIEDSGKHARFEQWLAIARGHTKIICGTRRALWFPFSSLACVVVDDEQHEYHKQADLNPRYHARTASLALAEAYRIPCLLASVLPSLEAHVLVPDERKINLPSERRVRVTRVSRLEEIRKGNYQLISEPLEEILQATLAQKFSAFLFHNRTGFFHQLQCRICESVLECETCGVPLFLFAEDELRCPRCKKIREPRAACKSCGGITFSKRRKGLLGLQHDLQRVFPQTPVIVLDRVRTQVHTSKPTIFLGPTSLIPLLQELPRISAVGVLHAEQLLQSHNFRCGERMVQTLMTLQSVCDNVEISDCIIQSSNPDHPLMQTILSRNLDAFYERELAERKEFGFPPAGSLAKFLIKDVDPDAVKKQAQELETTLRAEWSRKDPDIEILPPSPTMQTSLYKQSAVTILVRKKYGRMTIPWSIIPDDVLVDVEPEHYD